MSATAPLMGTLSFITPRPSRLRPVPGRNEGRSSRERVWRETDPRCDLSPDHIRQSAPVILHIQGADFVMGTPATTPATSGHQPADHSLAMLRHHPERLRGDSIHHHHIVDLGGNRGRTTVVVLAFVECRSTHFLLGGRSSLRPRARLCDLTFNTRSLRRLVD